MLPVEPLVRRAQQESSVKRHLVGACYPVFLVAPT